MLDAIEPHIPTKARKNPNKMSKEVFEEKVV